MDIGGKGKNIPTRLDRAVLCESITVIIDKIIWEIWMNKQRERVKETFNTDGAAVNRLNFEVWDGRFDPHRCTSAEQNGQPRRLSLNNKGKIPWC